MANLRSLDHIPVGFHCGSTTLVATEYVPVAVGQSARPTATGNVSTQTELRTTYTWRSAIFSTMPSFGTIGMTCSSGSVSSKPGLRSPFRTWFSAASTRTLTRYERAILCSVLLA